MKLYPQKALFSAIPKAPTAQPVQVSRSGAAESALGIYNIKPQPTQDQALEKQVRNWVGQTFFGTLLKQMRDDPFKSKLFSGGRGGEAFQEMYDGRLAQHMANGIGSKLVRPIVKQMKKPAADAYGRSQNLLKVNTAKTSEIQSGDAKTNDRKSNQEDAHVGADRRA